MNVENNKVNYNELSPEEYYANVMEYLGSLPMPEITYTLEDILELCRIHLHTPFFLNAYSNGILYLKSMEAIIDDENIKEEDLKKLYEAGINYDPDSGTLYYVVDER